MTFPLDLLSPTLAICRIDWTAPIPDWATGSFVSITRTNSELSIVCEQQNVPHNVLVERDWRCFQVAGQLDFSMVGIIAQLTSTLATAGISVFVISSYETDFLLVRSANLNTAMQVLTDAGHVVNSCNSKANDKCEKSRRNSG